jgi:hypothetical protein
MKTYFIYAIIDVSQLENLDNIDKTNLRYNKTKTKCIVKSHTEIKNLVGVPYYSKSQIMQKLLSDEWRNN